MRKTILVISLIIPIILFFSIQNLEAETVFLKRISVQGNRITKTSYIMEKVNLKAGKSYNIDDLMKIMAEIKSNLLKTGLFENLYFDDQLDDKGNLNLTIKVREKNYLFFGPEGNIYYKKVFKSDLSVYLEYTNLLGVNHNLKVSFPIYENKGANIEFETDNQKKIVFGSNIDIENLKSDPLITNEFLTADLYSYYNVSDKYRVGFGFLYNRYLNPAFISYPLIDIGSPKMENNSDSWFYSKELLKIGYGENKNLIYGLSANIFYFKDLFLQIIFKMGISFDYLDGDVPENLLLSNTLRGYPQHYLTGNIKISPRVELFIPLQWFPKLAVSLFIDSDIIGYNNLKPLIGGGVGIRWFSKYQNPFIIDLAFGNGFEINLSKKI